MIQRPLGRTGIHVSLLGLGTVKFGRTEALRYPAPFELPSERDLARLLDRAHDLGINLLDTAPAYGESEERLGRLLKGRREQWVLSTKVGEELEGGRSRFDFSANAVLRSVERSLLRLGTHYLDIVLVHADADDAAIVQNGETLNALATLKAHGKIRAFGVSHKTAEGGLAAVAVCDVVMTALRLGDTSMMPVVELAARERCGVLVKKALASGWATRDERRASLELVADTPGVSSVLVGTLDPEHLAQNVAAVSSARV